MPVPDNAHMGLTAAQRGIWFAQARDPLNPAYNTGEYVELRGPLDHARFEAALREAVDRTDALRLRFATDEHGDVRQWVTPPGVLPWRLHRVDVSGEPDPKAAAEAWMHDVISRPMDPGSGQPLFTQALLTLGPERHRWFQHVHHLVLDGYGVRLLARRVATAYGDRDGRGPSGSSQRPLPEK